MREAVSAQNCQTLEAICPLRLRHADNHQFTPCIVDVYVTVKRVQLKVEWKGAVYDSLTRLLKEQNVSAARPFSVLQYEVRHAMWAPLEALLPENVRSNRCCISDVLLPLDRPVKSNEEKIELNDAILICLDRSNRRPCNSVIIERAPTAEKVQLEKQQCVPLLTFLVAPAVQPLPDFMLDEVSELCEVDSCWQLAAYTCQHGSTFCELHAPTDTQCPCTNNPSV